MNSNAQLSSDNQQKLNEQMSMINWVEDIQRRCDLFGNAWWIQIQRKKVPTQEYKLRDTALPFFLAFEGQIQTL